MVGNCERPEGHEWMTLTRHPDPNDYPHARLANIICIHCSEMDYLEMGEDADD